MALVVPIAVRAKARRIRLERERIRASQPYPFAKYQTDPLGFFVDVLKIPASSVQWSLDEHYKTHKWDGTPDPFVAMLRGLVAWRNVGVESATTTGKTFSGAATVLWFLAAFENSLVVTIAPKQEQLALHIWKEIGKLWPVFQAAFPNAVKDTLRIRMRPGRDDWGAVGFVAGVGADEESATKAQGFHAEHMLLIYEETPGISAAIMTAFGNTCRAPHNLQLAFGNPDSQLDQLHRFCQGPRTDHIIISAYDHPNIVTKNPNLIPGAVSQQGIDDALHKAKSNGGEENRMFKSRVRGISPSEAAEALIKLEWIKRAQARWDPASPDRPILEAIGHGRKSLGVDASNSEDGDHAAIARGKGAVLLKVDAFPCPNSNNLGFKVFLEMQEDSIDDGHVGVDGVGVGAGAVNELRNRDRYIRNLIGGAKPEGSLDEEDWNNLRSQMHWTLREDLRLDLIALPPDDELAMDLITPTWKTVNGKIRVEMKEEIQKRLPGGRSPNKGDAAAYWNFVRPRDPVVAKPPPRAETVRERVMRELQALDVKPTQKRYLGVLRQ